MITKKDALNLPSTFGVYFFKKNDEILYIGKSVNIKARVSSHLENAKLDKKESLIVANADRIEAVTTESEFKALILESQLIKKYRPKYNVVWKDNKSYLYIKIPVKDRYPTIRLCRKEDDGKSLYFGPFSSTKVAENLLDDIRHIIPFCSQKNTVSRPCFYSKIGLCNPCPGHIVKIKNEVIKRQETKLYRRNILKIVKILRGNVDSIVKSYYKDLKNLSRSQNFEEAIKVRGKIFRLERLLHFSLAGVEVVGNDGQEALTALRKLLIVHFPTLAVPERIETYDISNLGMKNQVASMVVARNGLLDKSQYRRFKIKNVTNKSDFERLNEVMKRRFEQKWPKPYLLIVDGGRPQVKTILKALANSNLAIPVIGIAKNPDRLIIGKKGLPLLKPALSDKGFNLIRLLRDESHRFAKKYHLFLREKDFLI